MARLPARPPSGANERRIICQIHGVRMDPALGGRCALCARVKKERPTFNVAGRIANVVALTVVLGAVVYLFLPGFLGLPGSGFLSRLSLGDLAKPLGLRDAEKGSAGAGEAAEAGREQAEGEDDGPGTAPQQEFLRQRIVIGERHPLSSMEEVQRRVGWKASEMKCRLDDYDPEKEAMELVVPKLRSPAEQLGLLVWIAADDSGSAPAALLPVLKERRMAYAGIHKAGNERRVSVRINLALDAVRAAMKRTRINPDHVFVGGISGGAKSAAKAALLYPEVFGGGLFVVGADYYRSTGTAGGKVFKNGIEPSGATYQRDAARGHRFVLITGERDINREPVESIAAAMREDGFRHVKLLTPPGLGHVMPPTEVLDSGIAFLLKTK